MQSGKKMTTNENETCVFQKDNPHLLSNIATEGDIQCVGKFQVDKVTPVEDETSRKKCSNNRCHTFLEEAEVLRPITHSSATTGDEFKQQHELRRLDFSVV